MSTNRNMIWLLVLLVGVGCGYRVSGRLEGLPAHVRTVAVPMFENRTVKFGLEQVLTEAVKLELAARSRKSITADETSADAVLTAEILSFDQTPVAVRGRNIGNVFQVRLVVRVVLTDRRQDRILYEHPAFIVREEYILSDRNVDFFREEMPAIQRAAGAFARTVVATILEAF